MTIGISGTHSTIVAEFRNILSEKGSIEEIFGTYVDALPQSLDRYLICTGYLAGHEINVQLEQEQNDAFQFNFAKIASKCDAILAHNPKARICVIGSESGIRGSFDMAYAGAKAAMHLYIETKRLTSPDQLIVALAPHIITDSSMTQRRSDLAATMKRGESTRLGRWLAAREVAQMAYDVLYRWPTCTSGQVVRMRAD